MIRILCFLLVGVSFDLKRIFRDKIRHYFWTFSCVAHSEMLLDVRLPDALHPFHKIALFQRRPGAVSCSIIKRLSYLALMACGAPWTTFVPSMRCWRHSFPVESCCPTQSSAPDCNIVQGIHRASYVSLHKVARISDVVRYDRRQL